LNPWNYALANPIVFQDPSGHWCIAGFSIGPGRECAEQQENNWADFYYHQAEIWYQLGHFGGDAQAYVTGFLYEYLDIVTIVPTISISAIILDAIIGCEFRTKFDAMHTDDRFIAGRYAARAFLLIQAAGEIGSGLSGVGAGVSISLTGVGAAVGMPAVSFSTALVGHGAAVMAVLAIKGWADPLPAFFNSSGGSGSTGSTPKNPTNRDTASKNPSNWREAEEILEKDLGVPKNEEIFLSSEYGLEARRYRKPDFVGDDFIADAKWYSRASVSDSAQLRDYVKISISEGKPLWLYVRKNTTITSTAELSVLPYFCANTGPFYSVTQTGQVLTQLSPPETKVFKQVARS
jgi:hypothetical protein